MEVDNVADERPAVATLHFGVFDRTLDCAVVAERRATWPGGGFRLAITAAGHLLEWSDRGRTLVECLLARVHDDALLRLPVQAERRGRLARPDGLRYQVGLQVEVLDADLFVQVHDELAASNVPGLLHRFGPHDRIALAPLSHVTVEPIAGGLAIAAFHTFPAELAIVKTQSLIEA